MASTEFVRKQFETVLDGRGVEYPKDCPTVVLAQSAHLVVADNWWAIPGTPVGRIEICPYHGDEWGGILDRDNPLCLVVYEDCGGFVPVERKFALNIQQDQKNRSVLLVRGERIGKVTFGNTPDGFAEAPSRLGAHVAGYFARELPKYCDSMSHVLGGLSLGVRSNPDRCLKALGLFATTTRNGEFSSGPGYSQVSAALIFRIIAESFLTKEDWENWRPAMSWACQMEDYFHNLER